jgi:hypothetical protein
MVSEILATLLFGLSGFDAFITQKRITRYGVTVELNRAIQVLSSKFGPELGAIIGVMAPATALIALGLKFHLQWVLAAMVGFRLRQFFVQVESLAFERDIKEFAATLVAAASSDSHRPPSTVAPLERVEPKQSPIQSSKEGLDE